ncbi:hypothetical protein ALC60_01383 [Trachymyrmex zeteki]|uniref:Mutator-like transposase domain-containing protein n=1 Tax=Mycetomoellerius zeteki TaxID=64791 RepID=A0A151XGQ9_9HYME|nr:hypothetical protein ALC60_01383 [Trachymyrmex zeteki]
MDKKKSMGIPHRSGRRRFCGNRYTSDSNTEKTSSAAKKLKNGDPQFQVTIHPSLAYVIVQWSVFVLLQQRVACVKCGKKVEFGKSDLKGLGFQLEIICDCEKSEPIPSSPKINSGYEINRRIVYAMRLIGIGFYGLLNFCGLMDISASALSSTGYYNCLQHIYCAVEAVTETVFKKAAREEQEMNKEKGLPEDRLTVSGDGSWPKRGFTALLGIISLIGKYTNKVIDVAVRSKICQACSNYSQKFPENTPEFDAWFTEHCEAENCTRDHDGSAGLIEVEGVQEMFLRSVEKYGVMYEYYIGDGDSKTFKRLEETEPYGKALTVKKKACVLRVGKSIYRRGKEAKKNLAKIKRALKAQEKKEALERAQLSKLSGYFKKAVLAHPDSVADMKKAILASLYHKCSTDAKPQHEYCPAGADSWCGYQKTVATDKLHNFKHPSAFDEEVKDLLQPIYEELTDEKVLERCLGANTQNNNESYNSCVWNIAPKHKFVGKQTLEIAAFSAACIFNEGLLPILKVMEVMGVKIGPQARQFVDKANDRRVDRAELEATEASKEHRTATRNAKILENDAYEDQEGVVYEAGLDK